MTGYLTPHHQPIADDPVAKMEANLTHRTLTDIIKPGSLKIHQTNPDAPPPVVRYMGGRAGSLVMSHALAMDMGLMTPDAAHRLRAYKGRMAKHKGYRDRFRGSHRGRHVWRTET